MRYFILLSASLLLPPWVCAAASSAADDLAAVKLVPNAVYDPRSEEGRGITDLFSGIGVMIAGPGTDLTKTIRDKLDDPALRAYFPNASERARAAQRIGDDVKRRFLSNGYSNASVNAAMESVTEQVVGLVVPRVLQHEGVKDAGRANTWTAKILAPFQKCMRLASSYVEGQKCSAPLEATMMQNMGLAMTYEISRQEFGYDAAKARPAEYDRCLNPEKPKADSRVRPCALAGIRKSASAFGRARLITVAKKRMTDEAAEKLAATIMPTFDRCLAAGKDRGGFVKCGDSLIESAGGAIVAQTVLNDPRISAYFPASADRQRIASAGRDAFAHCMADNERTNHRDASGTLETGNCESFVALETTRTVASEVFRNTIQKNMPTASPAAQAAALATANARLAGCWDSHKSEDENGVCLRTTAKRTAVDLAGQRLSDQLPPDARDPQLQARLLKGFSDCLEQQLPTDLLHSNGADAAAAECGTKTVRDASLAVAELKVRSALRGELTDPDALNRLVSQRVGRDFGSCLGNVPDTAQINTCSLTLQKAVALDSAEALIPRKIDDYFQDGGIASYGLTPAQKDKMLSDAIAAHKVCLEQQVTATDSDQATTQINSCFKQTVHDLAAQLARLELSKQAKANGLDVTAASFVQTTHELDTSFSACLDQRKDASFTLDEYVAGLDACQLVLTKSFTSQLAKKELAGVARQVLGESADELERKLGTDFDGCMGSAQDTNATAACVEKLRSAGTIDIAKAGVRARAKQELGGSVPGEITGLEATLDACVAAHTQTVDDCAVAYVKTATKTLGHLILVSQVAKEIGAAKLARLAPEIKTKLEVPFGQCVDAVAPPLAPKLLSDLDVCGNRLTQNALDYMMHHKTDIVIQSVLSFFRRTPAPSVIVPISSSDVGQEELTGMMARTFLCLNDRPESLAPLMNLQPDSAEDKLLHLIGSYVSYDINNARGEYESVLAEVATELKAAGPVSARRKLLALLTERGMVDQLIKGLLKNGLQKSLAGKGIPANVTAKLTDKGFIDSSLTPSAMAAIRPKMAVGALEPVLIDGGKLTSPGVKRALLAVRADALESLLANPALGADESVREQVRQALKD